jgi:hypothetical protein
MAPARRSLLCRCCGHRSRGRETAGPRREQPPPAGRRDRFRRESLPDLTIGSATDQAPARSAPGECSATKAMVGFPANRVIAASPKLKRGRERRRERKHSSASADRRHRVRGNQSLARDRTGERSSSPRAQPLRPTAEGAGHLDDRLASTTTRARCSASTSTSGSALISLAPCLTTASHRNHPEGRQHTIGGEPVDRDLMIVERS